MNMALSQELQKLNPVQSVCCGLFALIVIGSLALEEYNTRKSVEVTKNWPVCQGKLVRQGQSDIISYCYQVNGKTFLGERIYFDQFKNAMYLYPNPKYKIGDPVAVHYNPQQNDFAVISTQSSRGITAYSAYCVGFLFSLGLIFNGLVKRNGYHYR